MDQDKIKQYFELKNKYAANYNKKRLRIIKDKVLSKKDKTKQLINLKKKENRCLNCKKQGGMIFKHKDRVLTAKCNATEKKCNLNININLDNYLSLIDLYNIVKKQLDKTKEEIIRIKLDLEYNFIEKAESIEKYNIEYKKYKSINKTFTDIIKEYNNIIINDKNKEKISELNVKLVSLISELKEIKNSKDNVEFYLSEIDPLVKQIRNIMYNINNITYDTVTDKFYLHQNIWDYSTIELNIDN